MKLKVESIIGAFVTVVSGATMPLDHVSVVNLIFMAVGVVLVYLSFKDVSHG